jgi:integrase
VKVGSVQRERRFPLGTDLKLVSKWREETRIKLRYSRPKGRKGTLAGDAAAYLRQVGHLASLKSRKNEVRVWVERLGDRLRDTITKADVLEARVAWLAEKTAPKTINNRVQTLRHLYRTLDGPAAPTPCDHIEPLHVGKTPPVFIPPELVREIETTLAAYESVNRLLDEKTRARFRVLASTGKRPSEIMRAQPEDVDLERRVWIVRDGKGGYSPGLYLNDDMVAAWELFIDANAWGPYNTNSFARVLRGAGWPKGVRPYMLRHTTWITASERGADLSDVQAGAGHKSIATTRRHYVPVLSSRMQKLSELLDHRFDWTNTAPSGTASGRRDKSRKP